MSSADFYDNFISYQIETGINDRIRNLYKRVFKTGISQNTNILEIGCGIGVLTYLLSRKIRKGRITGIDISPKSIEYAKTHITRSNLNFHTSDILDFDPAVPEFDRILLFDVLEHIQEENHVDLFAKISKWMNNQSLLLINIPNPNYILFDQKNNPQALQETDQPISIASLANSLDKASLEIEYLETYSVWVKRDYLFLLVRKRTEFTERSLSADRTFIERIRVRLSRDIVKWIHRYPVKRK